MSQGLYDILYPTPIKYASVDASASGDNTIVEAVTGKKVRVLAVFLVATSGLTVRFESDASGAALTGQMSIGTNGGFVLPFNYAGWFETATDELLNMELSAASPVCGGIVYTEVG